MIDTLADPGAHPSGPAQPKHIQALYEAFCRLPVHQQQALRNHYHLEFSPTGCCLRREVRKSRKQSILDQRRHAAYQRLRRDQALLEALGMRDAAL